MYTSFSVLMMFRGYVKFAEAEGTKSETLIYDVLSVEIFIENNQG